MKKESWHCDLCGRQNPDNEDFRNQVFLTGNGETKRVWRICEICSELVTDYLLDNQKEK